MAGRRSRLLASTLSLSAFLLLVVICSDVTLALHAEEPPDLIPSENQSIFQEPSEELTSSVALPDDTRAKAQAAAEYLGPNCPTPVDDAIFVDHSLWTCSRASSISGERSSTCCVHGE